MRAPVLDVRTCTDGSVILRPHGSIGPEHAGELRQLLVHTLRKIRPFRLVLDLRDVSAVDPISLGALAATCDLGEDHRVAVFVDNSPTVIAAQLAAAGVPAQRFRGADQSSPS